MPFGLVWVVFQLTSLVVTTLASPLTLLYHINRGREVHERDLNFCIVMLEESGLSLPTPLPWRSSPCVAELGGWVLWRREAIEPDQGFVRCRTWREGIPVLVFKINKHVMSFFFPKSFCNVWLNLCLWSYDDVIQIISSCLFDYHCLICGIMVLGRYNLFCRSLGARGARRGLKRKLGAAFSYSGVDLFYL